MPEIIVNLHMHTPYSDGFGTHAQIAQAALKAGLDAVIVTDHNVYVDGPERYYEEGERRVLLLVGEEIHDPVRQPQKSHLLVFGVNDELAPLNGDLQALLKEIKKRGGIAFAAHPTDPAAAVFAEEDLSWEDWQVEGLSGLEIWNAMSEFKSLLRSYPHAIYYAFNPDRIAHGPFSQTLAKWDEQLASGKRMAAIGGSDAHALPARLGPLKKTLFPYEYHFRSINTHLLIKEPLSGEVEKDRNLIFQAMGGGRGFVANDLPAPSQGFRFSANGFEQRAGMGEAILAKGGVTLQARIPRPANVRLLRDGQKVAQWLSQDLCTHITSEPGAYRLEVKINFKGREVGWIYSNPIYVR